MLDKETILRKELEISKMLLIFVQEQRDLLVEDLGKYTGQPSKTLKAKLDAQLFKLNERLTEESYVEYQYILNNMK